MWCQHYWSRDDTGAQRSDCLRSGLYKTLGPWRQASCSLVLLLYFKVFVAPWLLVHVIRRALTCSWSTSSCTTWAASNLGFNWGNWNVGRALLDLSVIIRKAKRNKCIESAGPNDSLQLCTLLTSLTMAKEKLGGRNYDYQKYKSKTTHIVVCLHIQLVCTIFGAIHLTHSACLHCTLGRLPPIVFVPLIK